MANSLCLLRWQIYSPTFAEAFHDITTGGNQGCGEFFVVHPHATFLLSSFVFSRHSWLYCVNFFVSYLIHHDLTCFSLGQLVGTQSPVSSSLVIFWYLSYFYHSLTGVGTPNATRLMELFLKMSWPESKLWWAGSVVNAIFRVMKTIDLCTYFLWRILQWTWCQ